jgi:hypothetical protein
VIPVIVKFESDWQRRPADPVAERRALVPVVTTETSLALIVNAVGPTIDKAPSSTTMVDALIWTEFVVVDPKSDTQFAGTAALPLHVTLLTLIWTFPLLRSHETKDSPEHIMTAVSSW